MVWGLVAGEAAGMTPELAARPAGWVNDGLTTKLVGKLNIRGLVKGLAVKLTSGLLDWLFARLVAT